MTTALCRTRPTKPECKEELAAGDSGHGGAHPRPKRNRDSLAHTERPLTAGAPVQNGGEPAESGGDMHGQKRK